MLRCIRFEPNARQSPVAAVAALKKMNFTRVFNDYDFGGYLIASGVAPFIDGRTEIYGEKFFVDHNAASGLMEPENLFRLLDQYKIEATLMRTQSAATKLLDHMDGWQKVYADDIATIHVRKADAVHTAGTGDRSEAALTLRVRLHGIARCDNVIQPARRSKDSLTQQMLRIKNAQRQRRH